MKITIIRIHLKLFIVKKRLRNVITHVFKIIYTLFFNCILYMQALIFNFFFISSGLKSLYRFEITIQFPQQTFKWNIFNLNYIYEFFCKYKILIVKTKIRYAFWLILSLPWTVQTKQFGSITDSTTYPYSWVKTRDICTLLYKNTNFFQICSERQQLLDVQLKEKLPYYLYLTNTESHVGPFSKQFLVDLEPYYYRLVLHCLKNEYNRDPLVYIRFAVDPQFRQLFFTQVSNHYLNLAKFKLSEIPITEYITQKLCLEAELRERLKVEIPHASPYSFLTTIELLYTTCIEHFYLCCVYPSKFSLQDVLQLSVGRRLLKFDPFFTLTLPHLYCIGLVIGIIFFQFALEDFSGRKIYMVRHWWMRVRYFFLTTLNLDIQGEDRQLWYFFLLTGIAPLYFCKYVFTFRINDLLLFLRIHGLPCTPKGILINNSSPVCYQSPILFLLIQNDARNVYYRTGFNRALFRHPELRESSQRLDDHDFFPDFLDLYPNRSVSTARFIEYMRAAETGKFSDGVSIGASTLFSGFNGYRPLLAHIGGRACFSEGVPYMEIVKRNRQRESARERLAKRLKTVLSKTYQHVLTELKLGIQPANRIIKRANRFQHLHHAAFMYKNFIEAAENLTVFSDLLSKSSNEIIVSVDELLYQNSNAETNYDDYVDTHGGEKALQYAVNEMKIFPEKLLRRRGYCMFYYSVKDLMYRYPLIFKGFVNINKVHDECHPYYKPMMTNVVADLANKAQHRITNPYDASKAIIRDVLLWFNPYFSVTSNLNLKLQGAIVEDPRDYIMTYKQLYAALKLTPQLVVLELLNSEWFDFRMYIDPSLNFEKIYNKYNYSLAERLTTRVAFASTRQTTFDTYIIERLHDKLGRAQKRLSQAIIPADTFLLTQTLLRRIATLAEKREITRQKGSRISGKYSPSFDKTLRNFPTRKSGKYLLSTRWLNLEYHNKRRLFYTPLSDQKHLYALEMRTDTLIKEYVRRFVWKRYGLRRRRMPYETFFGKYDYDAQFTHDVLMDMEVFAFINKHGIVGESMFNQALDAMIRRWGKKDPFIMKVDELYKTSKLDAFLALDPKIGRELDAKLKRINCSIDELYNMSFDDFKLFLDRHRVPTWLIEASVTERVLHRMSEQKMYESLMSDIDTRVFYPSQSRHPSMYEYTMNDIIAVQRNELVSWGEQAAEEVKMVEDGAINYRLLDKRQVLTNIEETSKKVYGAQLRHLKFVQMYDPKDFAYHRAIVERYLSALANDLLVVLIPTWVAVRLDRYFDIRYVKTKESPFLDDYDFKLHNLLQRLEKHFGLAKQLAGHKTATGRYLCSPQLMEYCEIFRFFENMDKILPKLCVGFSKNDDELDLTVETFANYKEAINPIVSAYKLPLPNSDLYHAKRISYHIYAPFTFEELAIVVQKYENIFVPDYETIVTKEYINKLCDTNLVKSRVRYKYYTVMTRFADRSSKVKVKPKILCNIPESTLIYSMFPTRDLRIVEQARQQKNEYAETVLRYKKVYTRLLSVRKRPEQLKLFPMLRYESQRWNYESRKTRLGLQKANNLFLRNRLRLKDKPYGHKIVKRLKPTSLRFKMKYSSENTILLFPPRTRRVYRRNRRLVRSEMHLYKRNRNVQYKNIYLQYLLNKAASQTQIGYSSKHPRWCDNLHNLRAYAFTVFGFRGRPNDPIHSVIFWYPYVYGNLTRDTKKPLIRTFPRICGRDYSIRFLRYLQLLQKYKKKFIFVNRQQQVIPIYTKPRELRCWYTIDYINGLKRVRKHTPALVVVERTLNKPIRLTSPLTPLWDLRRFVFRIFKTFVLHPRIRLLTGYIKSMPKRNFWLPEITGSVLKALMMRRDLLILEDIFYILNALNHAAENKRLRSVSFLEFVQIQRAERRNPNLFLLERTQQNQYYPQEIVADVARNNPIFVEKLLRVRRVLDLEYNIQTELLDSIVVTSFVKYRSRQRVFLKLRELTNKDIKFLYASRKGEYTPLVPRCVFAAYQDLEAESNITKIVMRILKRKRFKYYYRYTAPYIPFFETYTKRIRPFDMPFLVINKPFIDNILGIPLLHEWDFLLFKSKNSKFWYWYMTHKQHYADFARRYLLMYDEFLVKHYSEVYKDILHGKSIRTVHRSQKGRKAFKLAYQARERTKRREMIIEYFVNFLIPVKDLAETAIKPLKPYFTSPVNRTKIAIEDFVLAQGDQKLRGIYQDYAKRTEPWGIFVSPKILRRVTMGHNVQLISRRRNSEKIRSRRKLKTKRKVLDHIIPFPGVRTRNKLFIYSNLNHLSHVSIHNLLDEVILTGFYHIASPKLATNYHQRLLFTGLELSTGETSFGVWLNWSGGKPVKLWFPIYNNQEMAMSHGASGLIFLPRLTSYISEENIIEVTCTARPDSVSEITPFLEHKTIFSFLRWNKKMKERELWLHFFIYDKFKVLPGDVTYDLIYTFLYIQLHVIELFLKIL